MITEKMQIENMQGKRRKEKERKRTKNCGMGAEVLFSLDYFTA